MPLANGQGLLEDLFRLFETAQFPIEASQLLEGLGVLGVVFPQFVFQHLEAALQGLFRLAVSALFPVQVSQRIKDFADLGVAGSPGVLPNLQGALVKRPCFLEVPGLAVSIGQPFQGLG